MLNLFFCYLIYEVVSIMININSVILIDDVIKKNVTFIDKIEGNLCFNTGVILYPDGSIKLNNNNVTIHKIPLFGLSIFYNYKVNPTRIKLKEQLLKEYQQHGQEAIIS